MKAITKQIGENKATWDSDLKEAKLINKEGKVLPRRK